ncbi:MAG: hypothetical protein GY839_20300 [candidate division Zixibacteria bacterium]|nr:hypothetical protein [candidate division Zixibacteria bacterium]
MEWINEILTSPEFGLAILPASLLLGILTAFSSCCNIGIIAAVAGFAGSHDETFRRRDAVLTSVTFFLGTTISLALLGMLMGYFGQLVGNNFGKYGIILTAFAAIFFGLFALDLLPFKIPSINLPDRKRKAGLLASAGFGLAVGAASITCTFACTGPLLPIILGTAVVGGQGAWGALVLTMFGIGYSLPLAALMFGVGMGRTTAIAQKAAGPIRKVAGVALIGVGFWLLFTM